MPHRTSFPRYLYFMILCFFIVSTGSPAVGQPVPDKPSLLIFTKTEGFRHSSIPEGVKAMQQLAGREKIETVHTEDARYFHPDSLARFKIVVFLNTTGDVLDDRQQKHFKEFMQSGGGFLGIHAASDTEFEWPWYGEMVGAYFESHPAIQEATLEVVDEMHPATSFLPSEWVRTDEWYNFKEISDRIQVLIELDETSYKGGKNGNFHPVSWYQEFDGGRVFYTALGHTKASYSEKLFLEHLRGGLQYVLGKNK